MMPDRGLGEGGGHEVSPFHYRRCHLCGRNVERIFAGNRLGRSRSRGDWFSALVRLGPMGAVQIRRIRCPVPLLPAAVSLYLPSTCLQALSLLPLSPLLLFTTTLLFPLLVTRR